MYGEFQLEIPVNCEMYLRCQLLEYYEKCCFDILIAICAFALHGIIHN